MEITKIMVVEDEGIVAMDIKSTLESLGYDVAAVVSSGEEAVKKAGETRPDLVLMDIVLKGDVDGVEAAEKINARLDIPVVYLTAYSDEETLKRAKVTEPFGYILKPFDKRELHTAVEVALYKHKMESKLKESERRLATTLRSIGDAVIVTDREGVVTFVNPVAETLSGWEQQEALGKNLSEILNVISEKTRNTIENLVTKALEEGVFCDLSNNILLVTRNGTEVPIDHCTAPVKDDRENITGVVLVFRDITERRRVTARLEAALGEKELLMKEINHRVKNNLQVISSLLNLQLRYIEDERSIKAIEESRNRIKAITLLHEKLYQSEDMARVDFTEYVRELANSLFRSFGVNPDVIRLKIDIDDVALDISTATSCGLIINELISNSLKHAFPADAKGEINVNLHHSDDDKKIVLIIGDNGAGFPEEMDFRNTESFGLQLVCTLSEQLEGAIELDGSGGTTFKITFPTPKEKKVT